MYHASLKGVIDIGLRLLDRVSKSDSIFTCNSAIILLDESGDLGFSPNSSRFFVVAVLVAHDPKELVRLIKYARKKLGKRDWKGELKFNKTTDPIRAMVLKGVAKLDCQMMWIAFEKNKIPLGLKEDKNRLYRIACETVLEEAVKRTLAQKINIIIDNYYPKRSDRERLAQHIMSVLAKNYAGNFLPQVKVSQYDYFMSKELQVHDFIVGAIYQYLERGVDTYIRFIESKITFGQKRW